ncbi:hypothetical protein GCM10023155_48930 [Bremerella cremea]
MNGLLDRSDRQDGDYGNSSLRVEFLMIRLDRGEINGADFTPRRCSLRIFTKIPFSQIGLV